MDFIEIAEYCNGWLNHIKANGGTLGLIDALYQGEREVRSVCEFLQARNFHNREKIEALVTRHLMDDHPLPVDTETLLFVFLRAECAIFTLTSWDQTLRSRGTLRHSTDIPDEAMSWAMTGLWDANCYLFLARVARSWIAGLETALSPQIPGTEDPPWMDERKKR